MFERLPASRRQYILLLLGAVIAGMCVSAMVTALIVEDEDRRVEAAADPAPRFATVRDVARGPAKFFRREVSIAGEVAEVLGPHAVVLGGNELDGGDSLLVVSRRPFTTPGARHGRRAVLENDLVNVAGELRLFAAEDLERRLGITLGDGLARFEGDAVLVADHLAVTPRLLDLHDRVSIDQIIARPRGYIGKLVSIRGHVTDVVRGEAFVVDDKLLVLAGGLTAGAIAAGDEVGVVGGVRQIDPDQLPARGNVDEKLFGELARAPVIVAQAIERP